MKSFLLLGLGIILGSAITFSMINDSEVQAAAEKAAYLIISVYEPDPQKVEPYQKAVKALQPKPQIQPIAFGQEDQVQLIEGEWNNKGLLLIEKFPSMQTLKDFWFSERYQDVKKLREDVAQVNFMVAIEAVE